jgi:hypothetical protein
MKWGDTQTLVSVIIGLNLAYYAFKEIRGPHADRLRENLDKIGVQSLKSLSEARALRERISSSERTEVASLFSEFRELNTLATMLSRRAHNVIDSASSISVERRLGFPAMLVAIAAILLLIVSTFRYDALISDLIVYAMIAVGFLPIIGAIAINYAVLARIKTYEKELSKIGSRLIRAVRSLNACRLRQLILELEGDHDQADAVSDQPHTG